MLKKSVICTAALAFMMSFSVAAMADNGPATMTLGAGGKKPVEFNHAKHQAHIKCAECHHSKDAHGAQAAYVEGQKIEKCATCHDGSIANKKVKNFKGAAHVNCKGCHKAGKKGPTKCKECHVKKK